MFEKTASFLRWFFGFRKKEVSLAPPHISITAIIPAWNEEETIGATIKSLQEQTYELSEIIVIDDGSTDATAEVARSLGVTVIRTPTNLKKAGAQNLGLEHVKTELFLTVDADTMLAPNALYEAMRYFNDSTTEVVCGTIIPQRITNFWEFGRLIEYLYAGAIMKPAQDHNGLVLVASGCFSIFRMNTVRKYGGLDRRTIAEDMDLTWRIHEDGGRVYFANKAVCYPVEPSTFQMFHDQMDRWCRGFMQNLKVRNFNLFPRKRRMAILVYIYLFWYGISALLTPTILFLFTWDLMTTLVGMLAINGLFVWIPSLYTGIRMGVPWWKIVVGFVPYLFIPYINMFIYLKSAWKELVVGDVLTQWKKGH